MSPSIFGRMRARLVGAPAKAIAPKQTAEEQEQDREVVQKAISDAVVAALNNDDFTKAVAIHLASQLQPSLKAALDISTVEAKLLASTEKLSELINETHTTTADKLSDLSSLVDTNNTSSADRISALEESVAKIAASLADVGNNVKAIQDQVASPDTSLLSSHTAKLDTIATGLQTLQEQGPAPVATTLASHSSQLDAIVAELKSIQEQISAPDTTLLSSHGTKLDAIATQLIAIKTADASSEILAGIKASNDSHSAHASALSEIKSAQDTTTPALGSLKEQVDTISSTLSDIKTADISPEIFAAIKVSNESHAAHAVTLAEIKTATSTPTPVAEKTDLTSLETDLKTIITSLDSHSGTLSEIKAVSSVTEIKAAISAQDAVLAEIKGLKPSPEILAGIEGLKSDINTSKDGVIERVEAVKALVGAVPKPDNSEVLGEVKAMKALIGGTKEAEILAEIRAVKVIVEKTSPSVKVEEVGDNDKGVEVKRIEENGTAKMEGNGVEVGVKEVEA